MRLGFDAKRLFHNATGLGNYSRTLLANLRAAHPELECFLYSPKSSENAFALPFREDSGYVVRTATGWAAPLWRSFGVTRQLRRDGVKLYHGLSHELPYGLHRGGISSVVTIHDLIYRRHPEWYPTVDRWIYDRKVHHACREADRIIAISEHTQRDLVEFYGAPSERIDVVYQSCDPLFYTEADPAFPADALTRYALPADFFLFVGSLTPRKNLPLILDAYLQLPPADRLPLLIVGRGTRYRDRLMAEARYRPLHPLLRWIDDLDDNRHLRQLYRRARAVLYPSHYEGFGLPVAEALLSRTAVVTSTVSSLPEAGGPGALLVDPNRPEEMAAALHRLLHDNALRDRLISAGHAYAHARFGAAATTEALMESYRRALETR
ncbi:glycosyltransferase involved in cell wall biosynthesis [Lewinella marina]|uniref:Group 1 glycosyl transferase n=1 Tax=Neolewinella marina TaxID=438751 RepID=A0A2G0CGU8_9BACT|nr:glycosyltransferase family 1 protein [Neolewinella marina]NJB86326.1 glycosyltransferase involved in cell wall biosynthesis [Neolewinella marina]PHK99204.1 group 1 glycosyl transferase [Neolewinella marina]